MPRLEALRDYLAEARHYKDRAEHLRAIAAQDANPQTREALLAAAGDYDRLASKVIDLVKKKPPP
jgi:hypothetical protein